MNYTIHITSIKQITYVIYDSILTSPQSYIIISYHNTFTTLKYLIIRNQLPLAPHPHINPLPKHLRLHQINSIFLSQHSRRRQPIQHCLHRFPRIFKPDFPQPAAIHELNPLPELPFLKPLRQFKRFLQDIQLLNAVNPVYCWEGIIRILKCLLSVFSGRYFLPLLSLRLLRLQITREPVHLLLSVLYSEPPESTRLLMARLRLAV